MAVFVEDSEMAEALALQVEDSVPSAQEPEEEMEGEREEECVTEWSRGRRSLPLCVNMQLLLQSTDLTTAFFSNTISVAGNCVRAAAAAAEAAAAAMRYGRLRNGRRRRRMTEGRGASGRL